STTSLKKLSIGQKPVFIQPITSCTVPHGDVARFHARVSGMPKPEISWFHNQQPVQATKNVVFHFDEVTNTATLIIVDAFSEHTGQYTCRAANNAGEATCSATLTITIEEEGNFQSVLEGDPVELKCKLVACPTPTILWFHNNRSVPKERRRRICTDCRMHMHTTSLVIDSIKEKDSGSYKVMAINTEGSAESTASLLVSKSGEKCLKTGEDKEVESFVESETDVTFKQMVSEHHGAAANHKVTVTTVEAKLHRSEVPYSGTLTDPGSTAHPESRESLRIVPAKQGVSNVESPRPGPVT
uniref:Ig-like domain-containing protein n=1 Tax=Mastacembelus armatus TaxID=205130 RepID=A0A7N8WXR1_9TELE